MAADQRSTEAIEWRRWYRTARWRRIRHAQLEAQPLCEWCLEREDVEPATEVHHAIPHKGDETLFWNGPFLSTCKPCHSSRGQREDRGEVMGLDAEGWPSWRKGA